MKQLLKPWTPWLDHVVMVWAMRQQVNSACKLSGDPSSMAVGGVTEIKIMYYKSHVKGTYKKLQFPV